MCSMCASIAPVRQLSCKQRLPPPCTMQCCVFGERRRNTTRVATDAVGGWRGPLVPAAVGADSERRGRAVPVPVLGRQGQAERMLYATRAAAAEVFVVVVRFDHGAADGGDVGVGGRGGDSVLPSPIVAVRGEGLATSLVITCGSSVCSTTPSASTCSARCCGCPGAFFCLFPVLFPHLDPGVRATTARGCCHVA
jgi:hypothetical protein